ncbi:acyltransferase family protein [Bacillus gobiensis]|uniref:acyltransferase family protein n=1 Tax=Bacillus gobiensis TaxID=1441095 RepID=UPI003D1FDCA5
MNKRIYYLDDLRVFLSVLVLLHHAALPYTDIEGVWYVTDNGQAQSITSGILTFFIAINQSFFMGLFFFLSGYFTPLSYDRKTPGQFLKDRILRLGVPILVYLFVISPVVQYMALTNKAQDFWVFYQTKILTLQNIDIGPLWFAEALLIFTMVYVLVRVFQKTTLTNEHKPLPSLRTLFFTAILLAGLTFLVRLVYPIGIWIWGLQIAYFPSYILLFIAGIVAGRQNWLQEIPRKTTKTWIWILFFTAPLMPVSLTLFHQGNVAGGFNVLAIVYSMWESLVAFGICFVLLAVFKKYAYATRPFSKRLSRTAFTVYIIHPIFIVGYSLILQGKSLHPMLQFVIVGIAGTITCFLVAAIIVKIPYAKKIL